MENTLIRGGIGELPIPPLFDSCPGVSATAPAALAACYPLAPEPAQWLSGVDVRTDGLVAG